VAHGRCVALFRGINVGTAKRVAMADLRAVLEDLGCSDVRTLLNSGNAVFTPPARGAGDIASRIEKAVARRLKVQSRVTVLAGKEISEAIASNPFPKAANLSRLLVVVPRDTKARAALAVLAGKDWEPERLTIVRRFGYVLVPDGINDSALWAEVNRTLADGVTSRNMATVMKLQALCEEKARV
jgi:uncharacterized protein (DUF1697 family)